MVPSAYTTIILTRSVAPKKNSKTALAEAGKAHRVLFALLLDRKVVLDQNGNGKDQNEDRKCIYNVIFLADIIAYAHYYGCIESIAPRVVDLLWKLNDDNVLMKDVAHNSVFYLGLAEQLRNEKLFTEAMEHCASRPEHFPAQYRPIVPTIPFSEQLSEQVLALAVEKNRAILSLTFNLESPLLDILKTTVTGGLFQNADMEEQKKSRAGYLALGCITDFLINGSLDCLPLCHPEYQMISAPELQTGRFYRELMYTM